MPRMPRQPRSVPLHPRYTPEWPGRAYHYDGPMSTNDELKMLRTLKRDMPKEYQTLKDIAQRELEQELHGFPIELRGAKALDDIDARAFGGRRRPSTPEDPNYDAWQGSMRLTDIMHKYAAKGIAPAAIAARYAVSDQTKTTPRAAKKTTRKKK
jgi:hypothetical protein